MRKLLNLMESALYGEAFGYSDDPKPDPRVVAKFADVDPKLRSYYITKWADKKGIDSDDAMFMAGYVQDGYIGAGAWNWRYVGMDESVAEETVSESYGEAFEGTQWVENDDENLVISDVEKDAVGHVDDERDMLKSNLYQVGCSAVKLHKLLSSLPDNADLPHWWQAKVIKAQDYIDGALDYLEAELEKSVDCDSSNTGAEIYNDPEDETMPEDRDPSGVSGL